MKHTFSLLALLLLAAFAIWACGSDAAEMMGDAMMDAGRLLSDAGDAAAEELITGACDREYVRTFTNAVNGSKSEATTYYAEIDVAHDIDGLSIVGCDAETSDPDPRVASCGEAENCTETTPVPALRCQSLGFSSDGSRRIVINCGNRSRTLDAESNVLTDGFIRWTNIHVFQN